MSFSIDQTPQFRKSVKRLAQKHPSLKKDLAGLALALSENPYLGIKIGPDVYKIRLAITSKGRGKSGGARVITYVKARVIDSEENTLVVLVNMYDKSDLENMPMSDIEDIVKRFEEE